MGTGDIYLVQRVHHARFFIDMFFGKGRHADDRVHRRTDIVGHVGKELFLRRVRVFCLGKFRAQRLDRCVIRQQERRPVRQRQPFRHVSALKLLRLKDDLSFPVDDRELPCHGRCLL